jgi:hypothetical protein
VAVLQRLIGERLARAKIGGAKREPIRPDMLFGASRKRRCHQTEAQRGG